MNKASANVSIKQNREEMLRLLASLGVDLGEHNTFRFEGLDNVGPKEFDTDPERYRKYINDWANAQSESTEFTKVFQCLFDDGCYAIKMVCDEYFGGFNGKATLFTRPTMRTIKIGPGVDDETTVPEKLIEIPALKAQLWISNEYGRLSVNVETTKSNEKLVRGFLRQVENYILSDSIYKSKSIIVGQNSVQYMNIADIDPEAVFYNDHTLAALRANIWTMIEKPDVVRKLGIPLKSNVLLHGPYGCGKSLAGMLTAKVANKNGWTFIQVPHNQDLQFAIDVALLLAPTVFMVEDLDVRIDRAGQEEAARIMDILDGTQTKGKELIGLFTTNHPEVLQAGQWRKGRIDEQIRIAELAPDKMRRLVEWKLNLSNLNGVAEKEWDGVLEEMKDMVPAYVDGVVRTAQLYAVSQQRHTVTGENLISSAKQAKEQLSLQQKAETYRDSDNSPTINDLVECVTGGTKLMEQFAGLRNAVDNVDNRVRNVVMKADELKKSSKKIKEDTETILKR